MVRNRKIIVVVIVCGILLLFVSCSSMSMKDSTKEDTNRIDEEIVAEKKVVEQQKDTDIEQEEKKQDISEEELEAELIEPMEDLLQFSEDPVYSYNYIRYYLADNNISVFDADIENEYSNLMKRDIAPMNIKEEGGGFSKDSYYAITNIDSTLQYSGELKNNRPDGFGILYEFVYAYIFDNENDDGYILNIDDMTYASDDTEIFVNIIYLGYFKEGRFEGKGRKSRSLEEWENKLDELGMSLTCQMVDVDLYNKTGGDIQSLLSEAMHPLIYTGEFKNGEYSGKGTLFDYSIAEEWDNLGYLYDELLEDESIKNLNRDIYITTGEFYEGEEDGYVQNFSTGFLWYEGDKKNGKKQGNGIEYYAGTEQIKYKGEFSNNQYNGKGILYNEDGTVIYDGKWRMGDYAN